MCELFAVSSAKPASITYSLREFALHGGEIYHNNSGWVLPISRIAMRCW